ncbi:chaperone modulator CbpM [Flavobacterium granuli]|uniref:MerR HTH family regulatory protein n=1 Tax=Flavobacterium granuli TaxID=280093 RepID=A0A1M5I6U2_9FLAO|nr:chaperone modulator CbpM [Flavobacterium granuli]PRZ27817.1 MerR-like DNA binding protein [Flavobacterium granuli]SHG23932.1 MerR HTH family regulatory protein [Flavobacterium granuli]
MNTENFIPLSTLSIHYKVELTFFDNLNEIGLIEIQTINQTQYVHQDSIYEIEKIIRLHQELDVNIEGIDVVFNLLQKIDALQTELLLVRNRLQLYEN